MFRIFYRFLTALARHIVRSGRSKDLEIIVLRHQVQVLRRQVARPPVTVGDRTLLGALAAALPLRLRQGWIVTPETLQGLKILKTPVRTPVANTFAERWIGPIRRELLDRTIIWNRQQLERLVVGYINHYDSHRPHRSLQQRPPAPAGEPSPAPPATLRTTRCDGLINEYENAA